MVNAIATGSFGSLGDAMAGAIHPSRDLAAQPQFDAAVPNHVIVGCRVSLPEAGHREIIHHA